ncbi:MAG: hypothetical protein HY887_01250, partial [Deltaproteobacteria bacterium]|nr:hypothetical protein [Deltaproteobacteria bacterium]
MGEDVMQIYGRKTVTPALALFAAVITFLVYLPALQNGFVNWDDSFYVYRNPNISALNLETVKWAFRAEVNAQWHPLTILSFTADYAIWGLNPKGYHLTNNIFHALNTFLIFMITWRLFDCGGRACAPAAPSGGVIDRGPLAAALITALLFGLHPMRVESVAWVTERKDVLYAFFFLLSILAYLRYVRHDGSKRASYLLCLACFILALMSKPMAVTLPVVLLILDLYPLGRLSVKGIRHTLIEKIPFFALSVLISAVTLWAQLASGMTPTTENIPIPVRIAGMLRGYLFYLYKTFWPFDLAPLYPYRLRTELLSPEHMGYLSLLIGITVFCVIMAKTKKIFLAAWLYYLVTLLPVIGLMQVGSQAAADRFTYLPSLGPFTLIGAGAAYLIDRYGKKAVFALMLAMAALSALMAVLTVRQISIWKDSITLWSREIELFPVIRAYSGRATQYFEEGNFEEAAKDYTVVINSKAGNIAVPYNNRGVSYLKLGRLELAIKDF